MSVELLEVIMPLNLGIVNQSIISEENLSQDILDAYDAYVDLSEFLLLVKNSHEILHVASQYKSSAESISAIETLAGTNVSSLQEISTEAIKYGVEHLVKFLERIGRALNGLKAKANRIRNKDFSNIDPKLLANELHGKISSKTLNKAKSLVDQAAQNAGLSKELASALKDLTTAAARILNVKTVISDPKAAFGNVATIISTVADRFPEVISLVKKESEKISGTIAIANAATSELGQTMINAGLDKICQGIVRAIKEIHMALNAVDGATIASKAAKRVAKTSSSPRNSAPRPASRSTW